LRTDQNEADHRGARLVDPQESFERKTFMIDPRTTALLVMDYQNGIVGSLAGSGDLLDRASQAIAAHRQRGGHIGFVRVGFDDADFDAMPAHSAMASRITPESRVALHADSPHTAIHDSIAPEPGDIVVRKTRVGAFSTTDLEDQLRERGIDTLLLAGISTSGVVLSTVRDAADKDYRVIVLADACADRDPQVHSVLTEKVFPAQARVITTDEAAKLFSE
jgi:nicotinamidase-related amidase